MTTEIQAPALRIPRLGRWWWVVLAFWIFLGFVIANQIFWSMRDHHHDWWRIFLWQAGACAVWTLLVPVVLALARWVPIRFSWRPLLFHLVAAILVGAMQMAPAALLALVLDPFRPVAEATSFVYEYQYMVRHWLVQDLIIYVALLGLAAVIDFREAREARRIRDSVLETELARAQLRALRLELQPHFIFNSLNAAVGLLRRGDAAQTESMLICLSDFLRSTLDGREKQLVPLAEELRLVRLYLDIEQVRFADRLRVDLAAGPGTENALVPSLLLQPLVENAVRHGVAKRAGGQICVSSAREGGRLLLRVTDDGPGPGTEPVDRGIGLENAVSRLQALYGAEGRLDLLQGAEGGAEVAIEIPWREAA